MIRKTIGIATILLLILVIVLGVGIRNTRANTLLVHHPLDELRPVEQVRLRDSRYELLLLRGVRVNSERSVLKPDVVLRSGADLVLHSDMLRASLRRDSGLVLSHGGLDSLLQAV